jgi:preprotein translocase subunit SecG
MNILDILFNGFTIGLYTVVLVLDCLALILLVLIQLPKKEAGAGLAFGGGATDALFGAGSGNVLTTITKWAAGIFFSLAIIISLANGHVRKQKNALDIPANWKPPVQQPVAPTTPPPATTPAATPVASTNDLLSIPIPATTNVPAAK